MDPVTRSQRTGPDSREQHTSGGGKDHRNGELRPCVGSKPAQFGFEAVFPIHDRTSKGAVRSIEST